MKNQDIEKRCVLRAIFVALFLSMVLVLSGCGEKGTPSETQGDDTVVDPGDPTIPTTPTTPVDPGDSSSVFGLILSSDPLSIPADGSSQATISATVSVENGGAVPDGTTVSFSIGTSGGSITPTATTTGGIAIATLTSGTTFETVVVRAEAGGKVAEMNVVYTRGSVTVSPVPNSLLGTSQETSKVTVTVLDTGGRPKQGVTVTFGLEEAPLGTLSQLSDVTDVKGEAHVDFIERGVGGTATITANWTDGGVNITGSSSIEISWPPAFLQVAEGSPDPASINVRGTGGQSTSQIRFDVRDSRGNLVADGYPIHFDIESGPGGGEGIETSALTSGGTVSTILYSGSKSGPVSIKATYAHNTAISTTASQIVINSGQPVGEEIGIFAEYLNISGLHIANLEDGITFSAGDIYGNPVPDNTAISFKTYNTGGLMETADAPTSNGIVSKILHSTSAPPPIQGFVSVTAEINNGGRSTRVTSMAVTPGVDNNYMYAGTNGGGVYKSTNHGENWQNISRSSTIQGQNWIDPYVNDIVVDPDDANTLYAATGYLGEGNIYRSLDGGASWNSNHTEEWHGLLPGLGGAALSVVCSTGDDYVWVGTDGFGAIRSEDGEHFTWGGAVTPSVPDPDPDPDDGRNMSSPILGATAQTEAWTVNYAIRGTTTSGLGFNGAGDGTMTEISATVLAQDEVWTATYQGGFDAANNPIFDNNGHGTLTVISAEAVDATYTVTCTDGTDGAEVFSVRSSSSGFLKEFDDITQNYEDGGVTFYVLENTLNDFIEGDIFTFTTSKLSWQVGGSLSGVMTPATTGLPYTSDNGEVSFTIKDGDSAPYEPGDMWSFGTTPLGEWLASGTVSGMQTKRAITNLAYTSDHGEVSFIITEGTAPFVAGDAFTFDVTESGLGFGKVVRDIVKASGNGSSALLYAATPTGVFKSVDGGAIWAPTDRFTGDNITTLAVHPVYDRVIYVGTRDAGVWTSIDGGGSWEPQDAGDQDLGGGNEQGRHIKDLEVDKTNNKIYAITYFWGVDEPHSTGTLYKHDLVPATGAMTGDWIEVSQGLPPYSLDDPTRLAQHVLAVDDPTNPTALYIGGEGISMSKKDLVSPTDPIWQPSQDGLTNRLMARMPILFSGICTMDIDHVYDDVTKLHTFTVYIQDINGNPPIGGSTFTVQKEDVVLQDTTYMDAYTHAGTFRDPSDPSTDRPYVIVTPIGIDEELVFEFTPTHGDGAPGSSGATQTVTY